MSIFNGLSADVLSDLTDVDILTLEECMPRPQNFTIAEVADLAPHVGMTVEEFVRRALTG